MMRESDNEGIFNVADAIYPTGAEKAPILPNKEGNM